MPGRRAKNIVESDGSESDQEEEIRHDAHATVSRNKNDKIIPVAIPTAVSDCFKNFGNGHWGNTTVRIFDQTVTMNKTSVNQMDNEALQEILELLFELAGFTSNPRDNKTEEYFTGYVYTQRVISANEDEPRFTQVFDGSLQPDYVSLFETNPQTRKMIIPIAKQQLANRLKGNSFQDIAMIQHIMVNLINAVPNPEADARAEQQKNDALLKRLERNITGVEKYALLSGKRAEESKLALQRQQEKNRLLKDTQREFQDYWDKVKHVKRMESKGNKLAPAVQQTKRLFADVFLAIDKSLDKPSPADTGQPPRPTDTESQLLKKQADIRMKSEFDRQLHEKAEQQYTELQADFIKVGTMLRQILDKSEGWHETKLNLDNERHKQVGQFQRKVDTQKLILDGAKANKDQSMLRTALNAMSSLFQNHGRIGSHRVDPIDDDADDDLVPGADADRVEESSSTRDHTLGKSTKKRKADEAEQVKGGGAAAKGARRSSRRGQ